jgi:hypothetical protein
MANLKKVQEYLLDRIPRLYDLQEKVEHPMPADVKKAMEIIETYNNSVNKRKKDHESKMKKLIESAKEAIYLGTEAEALKAVKLVEAEVEKNR